MDQLNKMINKRKKVKGIIMGIIILISLFLLVFGIVILAYNYDKYTMIAGILFIFFAIMFGAFAYIIWKYVDCNKLYNDNKYKNINDKVVNYGISQDDINDKVLELKKQIDEIKKKNNI